jgi:RNA polymerase sigma-70 factor (sigma-E family)
MSEPTFSEFVTARGQELTRFAWLLSRDPTEAQDLVQDTLAAAYVSWRRIERSASPEAYVRRMMVNRHISIWRRHRNRIEPRPELPESAATDPVSATVVTDAVRMIVRGLPPRQRAAIVLRYYADCPDREIADALGCSTATVRSQICRALSRLRAAAEANDIGPADLALIDVSERTSR